MTPGTDNLYIERAGDTLRRGTNNHVGVLDFTSIGTLVKVTPKVSSVGPNVPYKEGVRLTVPATPSTSVFLVLGGYLVFVDGLALTRVSDTDYILDIRHIPFVERISESSEYMQMNDLGLSIPFDVGDSYSVEEVMSDAVIDRYITAMTQSFMVVCPVVSIVIEEVPIRKVGSIGTFITYQEPKYPLRLGYGKLSEYWKISEGAKWAVKVSDYVYGNYVLAESPVSASRHHPYSPYMYTNAHLLKITGYKI
jgi:hypothetical protein